MRSRVLRLLFWTASLLAGAAAHATVLCVATVSGGLDAHDYGLVAAFTAANTGPEGGTWDIRLRPNTYQLSSDLVFNPDGSHDFKSFYFSGGWDATCSTQTGDASNTIVRGVAPTQTGYSTRITFAGDNERYDIEKIRFENFVRFSVDDKPCGVLDICPDTNAMVIEQDEFSNGGWLSVRARDADRFVFRNNLVAKLNSIDADSLNASPVLFLIGTDGPLQEMTFNTFADISCKNGDEGGISIFSRKTYLALHHNLVQTNGCAYGIYVQTGQISFADAAFTGRKLTPYYNLFSTIGGGYDGDLLGNGNVITTNTKFVDAANGNFRLQTTSPAVNAGATLLEALESGFIFSPIDLDAKSRPVAAHFDIGAYESNVVDSTPAVITVNSANDVDDGTCNATHCSLREAINLANLQGSGTDQRIVFDITGSCPRVILLNSALPDITVPLTIDGYTQPGANENDADYGSDANICIALTPAATGISHALAVTAAAAASTRLVVRGLAFGNGFYVFGTDAIDLRGGSGHRIVGNAFGGYLPPAHNTATLGTLPRAVLVRGTATNVKIGTPDPADRNYLGNLTQNGIVLNDATSTGHTIQNNYIGVEPDGLTAQANQADGISASGGSNVTIDGNTIAASDYGISLLGSNTKGFTLTGNRIGLNALGIPNATLSNNVGIVIALGSGGHVIGAAAADLLSAGDASNFIANNLGDGVLLAADAGDSNSIRGNAIFSNGKGGSGIGIDLGNSQTQLANDAGDTDTGPNALQNYPIIKGSAPTDTSHRNVNAVLGTSANQAVRVDFYQSPTCGGIKGADATNLVGTANVNSGATGVVNVAATIVEAGKSGYLTATATTSTGQTSELAPCVLEDTIFADGHEPPGL